VGSAAESILVGAPVAEVWDFYFEPAAWPSWVDGFGEVESSNGYPEIGGSLRWRSVPAGRGVVEERVLEHEPRRVHRIAFSDELSEGELVTWFEIATAPAADPGTLVSQEMEYRLRRRGPLGFLTDFLFVRPQIARSLARSLERLRSEVAEMAASEEWGPAAAQTSEGREAP
jgi:uncharacterized protein YndB with AHSA1/START domain